MVSFCSSYFSLVSLLLLGLLRITTPTFANPSVKVTKEVINDICSKSSNPPFCLTLLNSDPGVATADLPGLASITIGIGYANASDNLNYIKSLLEHALLPEDPSLKERYLSCSENYDEALNDFDMAKQSVGSGNYGGANSAVSGALTQADTCNDDLQGSPPDPSQLSQRNQNIMNLCSIILVIINRL